MRDFSPYHYIFMRDFSHKDAVKATDTKSGCTCPKAHATASYISFYYYCLSKLTLLCEVDLVVYIYSLCNGCTTNCEDKSENHHNLNPFFNFLIVILTVFFCVSHLYLFS